MKMKIKCFVLFPSRQLLSSEFSSVSDATLHRTHAIQTERVVLVQEEGGDLSQNRKKWGIIENILL